MLSLRAVLAEQSTLLILDSSSARIYAGLLRAGHSPLWVAHEGEAGTGLFVATETVLSRAALRLSAVTAFAFCDGPGSVLGIRTAAVALRTWNVLDARPAYAFSSLALVALSLARSATRQAPFSVIADARRDTWHRVAVAADGTVSALQRVSPKELSGPLIMPASFRHWSALPGGVTTVPYDPPAMFAQLADVALFRPAPQPDAFLHEEPTYQTWTPQVHRPPTARTSP